MRRLLPQRKSRQSQRWPIAFGRVWAIALIWAMSVRVVYAGVSVTPVPSAEVLFSDNFDASNTAGTAPANWHVNAPDGTLVRVVDASVTEPFSPPYCVELVDNSPKGRAEMYRGFSPSSTGQASAVFKTKTAVTAHAVLQLRTATGAHLCSLIFAGNGLMRYEGLGGAVNSTTPWKPGEWQSVQVEWFADSTFTASLGDTAFAQRVRFVTNGVPGRVYVIVGYSTVTNRIGYVDDVKVTGAGGARWNSDGNDDRLEIKTHDETRAEIRV